MSPCVQRTPLHKWAVSLLPKTHLKWVFNYEQFSLVIKRENSLIPKRVALNLVLVYFWSTLVRRIRFHNKCCVYPSMSGKRLSNSSTETESHTKKWIVSLNVWQILSIGYNGFPPWISNSKENWSKELKEKLVVHAEANAVLLKGTANLENSIAFVTLFPCNDCAKMLIQVSCKLCHAFSFIVLGR